MALFAPPYLRLCVSAKNHFVGFVEIGLDEILQEGRGEGWNPWRTRITVRQSNDIISTGRAAEDVPSVVGFEAACEVNRISLVNVDGKILYDALRLHDGIRVQSVIERRPGSRAIEFHLPHRLIVMSPSIRVLRCDPRAQDPHFPR